MFNNLLNPLKTMQVVFFVGAAAGAVVGTVAGMTAGFVLGNLFAPKAGNELRHDIADKSKELAGQLKEKSLQLKDKAGTLYSSFSEDIKSRRNDGKSETEAVA
ncbi:MAG: YtxH domain-containing protein [Candidatus Obscuribacterales bacterium]|jgi:gas vesicle protein|nr:YtxH domain-containing protein [Candidatus Obscuribacterales bacterium]